MRRPERPLLGEEDDTCGFGHVGSNIFPKRRSDRNSGIERESSLGIWIWKHQNFRPQVSSISLLLPFSLLQDLPSAGFYLSDPAQLSLSWNRTVAQCWHHLTLVCVPFPALSPPADASVSNFSHEVSGMPSAFMVAVSSAIPIPEKQNPVSTYSPPTLCSVLKPSTPFQLI